MNLKVSELTFDQFLKLRTKWNSSLQESIDNQIFLTWEWLTVWWKHFGDRRAFHMITVTNDGRIVAAAPLMSSEYTVSGLKMTKIEFIGTPTSDYHTFLLTERNPEHVRMMIEYIYEKIHKWDCIELGEIPENSATANILTALDMRFRLKCRVQNICPYISLPPTFADFFKRLSRNLRHNLNRYEMKLRRKGHLGLKICKSVAEVRSDMNLFFAFHQKRWRSKKRAGAVATKQIRDFHLDIAESFADKGWLKLSFLTINDVPVSSKYGFDYGGKLYSYLSGWDPEYSNLMIGNITQAFLIRHCVENDLMEYDFMRGNEPYKARWNTIPRRNLEFWTIKRKFVPFLYATVAKNPRLSSLASVIGTHTVLA